MIEIIKKIIANVLTALYEASGFAIVLAILFMFLYIMVKEHGCKKVIKQWLDEFKTNKKFRRIFFLVFYTAMILFRTLLNRYLWLNPLADVIGIWGIYDKNGELTTEVIENLVLFIPFAFLLLCCYREKIVGESTKLTIVLSWSALVVLLFSLTIEILQLFLQLGTFQLSDLFYNTLGGIVGGLIFWICCKVSHKD